MYLEKARQSYSKSNQHTGIVSGTTLGKLLTYRVKHKGFSWPHKYHTGLNQSLAILGGGGVEASQELLQNQTDTGIVSKTTMGKLPTNGVKYVGFSWPHRR